MNKIKPLDQDIPARANAASHTAKLTKKFDTQCSIWDSLKKFAYSVPDFRRTGRGNIRHVLGDVIILMILARMSRCVGRADIIEYGKHNLRKFQSMGMLKNGVPSEPTLCRVENGIDAKDLAGRMAELTQAFHEELVRVCRILEIICVDGKVVHMGEG